MGCQGQEFGVELCEEMTFLSGHREEQGLACKGRGQTSTHEGPEAAKGMVDLKIGKTVKQSSAGTVIRAGQHHQQLSLQEKARFKRSWLGLHFLTLV